MIATKELPPDPPAGLIPTDLAFDGITLAPAQILDLLGDMLAIEAVVVLGIEGSTSAWYCVQAKKSSS